MYIKFKNRLYKNILDYKEIGEVIMYWNEDRYRELEEDVFDEEE
ncbi:MAG: hypothetical protein AABY14_02705 [Nanoarchaeota archaeon]